MSHVTRSEAPKQTIQDGDKEIVVTDEKMWQQENMMVLSILQSSLETSILEAYSYYENTKYLWDTLQKVYGNVSNLSCMFEVKQAHNNLHQEGMEFTQYLENFRSLWFELEMLSPISTDPAALNERCEQDKRFGLLLNLNPVYNDLIKHILRSGKLSTLEEVCAHIQKEKGSLDLFGGKGDLALENKAVETPQANKVTYMHEERRFEGYEHCKKRTQEGAMLDRPPTSQAT